MDLNAELTKIIHILYDFVLVSSMGIFGSMSGILYSKEKLTKKEILANLFIACFISVIIKLVFYEFKNNFLLLAVIGTLCFNTKKAIGLIMLIPSIFLKTGALEKIIQAAVNESSEVGEVVIKEEEETKENKKDVSGIKKNEKKQLEKKENNKQIVNKSSENEFENYSDYNSGNCLREEDGSCRCDDFNFCDSCSNQEKLLVLKRKKIYEMKSKIRNNRSKSNKSKELSTTNKIDDEVK